jgi:RNA polymerase sigma-70 factor, ECF subfamily
MLGFIMSSEYVTRASSTTSGADSDDDVRELIPVGDVQGAMRRLMQRHGTAVYRYCREALRDAALADDVHQQVFIEASRALRKSRGYSTIRTWLFAIARHRVLDVSKRHRQARADIDMDKVDESSDPRPFLTGAIDDAQLHEALVTGLGVLGGHARTTLLLRYQQGFTFEEMAEICREKPEALHARVARALQLLWVHIGARANVSH